MGCVKLKKLCVVLVVILFSIIIVGCNDNNHSHNYNMKNDLTMHYYECDCGDIKDNTLHSYVWVIDKYATETEFGYKHQECEVCKFIIDENTLIEKAENGDGYSDKLTGPSSNYQRTFASNNDFYNFVRKFNTLNRVFVSFNFDDSSKVGNKAYIFNSIISNVSLENGENIYDYQVQGYSITYVFESFNDPIGSGVYNIPFKVECFYKETHDYIEQDSIIFELESFENNSFKYKLKSNECEIMEINISVGENESDSIVTDILTMLRNNIVFLR